MLNICKHPIFTAIITAAKITIIVTAEIILFFKIPPPKKAIILTYTP
jgi:hypothetical protein